MTLDEMRTSIRSNMDDTLGSLYTDDQLRIKIDSALRHIWNELNKMGKYFNTATEVVSFVANSQEITLTGDIHTIIWVRDCEKIPIDVVSEAGSLRSDKRSVYLTRTISAAGDTRTRVTKLGYFREPSGPFDLTIKYNQQITVFGSTANGSESYEDIPLEHHNVIVLYATILCLPKYEENSQEWKALYQVEFANLADVLESENVNDMAVVDVANAEY